MIRKLGADCYVARPQHRWRHTLSSVAYDVLDISERTVSLLMNHRSKRSIARHYGDKQTRLDWQRRVDALQRMDDYVANAMQWDVYCREDSARRSA